ncbi:hypothetical protein DPV78_007972 [Talaromyces pinophilus]|nr:hypothetical protein DPV78_007972 [Talaromyces pinophilus]
MKDTISQLLNQCLRDFTAITDSQSLFRYETEVSHRRWLDELGRLRVWSGNIGAHQTGQSSLDYRLRDASHLREETRRLLSRLLQIFQDLSEVLNEDDEEALDIEIEDDDESTSLTEVQQLYQSITDAINSLFQISIAIRSPADHDRLLNTRVKDNSFFELWARQHVSRKYPDADDTLISRLGKAMARQKAVLKYRERHRAKLGKGLSGNIETTSTKLSETVATEIAPDNDHLQFLETASNSGLSQTSYATSLMETKMAKSIPKPPKASKDRSPFECPYCFHIIVIKHKKDWARHIFRDVMPYVCLSMNCATPSKLYESRHQWFSHMRELHAQGQNGLACPLCQAEIQVLSSFEKHVGRHLEELALFFLPPTDVDMEEASEASPSVLSINRGGSVGLPTSDFNYRAPEDPYLSDPSYLEEFGFRQQPHTPSASSAGPLNRLSSLPPADQSPSSETYGLQVPTGPESTEEKSNIIAYGPRPRVGTIGASDMGENDLSVSSRGSESDARTRSGSGTVKSSRPEDGSGFTMTMNGITFGFSNESVLGQRIHLRTGSNVIGLDIERRRPKKYITPSREYDDPSVPEVAIAGKRSSKSRMHSRKYTTLNSASKRVASADGYAQHTPETTSEGELIQTLKTRGYQVREEILKGRQERPNRFDRESWLMGEGVSTFEDDIVFRGRERQHISASQPLKADTVTEGRVLPKPSDPVRHQNRRNRPQVVQVSQSTLQPELERNPGARRLDIKRDRSEERPETQDPVYIEYGDATVFQPSLRPDSLERNRVVHRPDARRRTSLDMFDRGTCLQTY